MRQEKGKAGFTLIELMVVVSIIGILSAIAIPRFTAATAAANTAKIQADLRSIESAVVAYYAVKGVYPTSLDELAKGAEKFLEEVPEPVSGDCYVDGTETSVHEWRYGLNGEHRATFNGKTIESFRGRKS